MAENELGPVSLTFQGKDSLTSIIDKITNKLSSLDAVATKSVSKAAVAMKAAGAVATVAGVAFTAASAGFVKAMGIVNETIPKLDKIVTTADRLQIKPDFLMGIHHAAEMTNSSVEAIDGAIIKILATLGKAEMGMKGPTEAFKSLGLKLQDFEGLTTEEKILRIIDAIQAMPNVEQRMAALGRMGGGRGMNTAALVPMFAEGSASLRKYIAESKELNYTMTAAEAAAIKTADAVKDRVNAAFEGLKIRLTVGVLPAIENVGNALIAFATNEKLISALEMLGQLMEKIITKTTAGIVSTAETVTDNAIPAMVFLKTLDSEIVAVQKKLTEAITFGVMDTSKLDAHLVRLKKEMEDLFKKPATIPEDANSEENLKKRFPMGVVTAMMKPPDSKESKEWFKDLVQPWVTNKEDKERTEFESQADMWEFFMEKIGKQQEEVDKKVQARQEQEATMAKGLKPFDEGFTALLRGSVEEFRAVRKAPRGNDTQYNQLLELKKLNAEETEQNKILNGLRSDMRGFFPNVPNTLPANLGG